jgi:GNAT superfamily N-acetyltransferase
MPITYHPATSADLDDLTRLLGLLYGLSWDTLYAENTKFLTEETQAFFLARDGDTAVGVSHGALRREYVNGTNDGGPKGYLEAIYVLPNYRRQGIAAQLAQEVEHWAASRGCREMASDCLLHNITSHRFHVKIGFSETERCVFFLKNLVPQIYRVRPLDEALRKQVQPVLNKSWGGPQLAVNGKLWDSETLPGFAAANPGALLGYLLYAFHDGECEVMVLESLAQKIGVGSALLGAVREAARRGGASRLIVQTSNDNTHALRFYQRRGFALRVLRPGAMALARQLKPSIPKTGSNGIPLRDELELVMEL